MSIESAGLNRIQNNTTYYGYGITNKNVSKADQNKNAETCVAEESINAQYKNLVIYTSGVTEIIAGQLRENQRKQYG